MGIPKTTSSRHHFKFLRVKIVQGTAPTTTVRSPRETLDDEIPWYVYNHNRRHYTWVPSKGSTDRGGVVSTLRRHSVPVGVQRLPERWGKVRRVDKQYVKGWVSDFTHKRTDSWTSQDRNLFEYITTPTPLWSEFLNLRPAKVKTKKKRDLRKWPEKVPQDHVYQVGRSRVRMRTE